MPTKTFDKSGPSATAASVDEPLPGLALVFVAGKPAAALIPLGAGEVEIGRDHPAFAARPDPRLSRRHASVRFEGGRFVVTDRGSHNGTSVDGESVNPASPREATRVIRAGDSLFVPMRDIRHLERSAVCIIEGRPEPPAPPRALRDRPEEIPWLLQAEVRRVSPSLSLHVLFVEACLLRPWPGDVRELGAEARSAARAALDVGSTRVELRHLSRLAGAALPAPPAPSESRKRRPRSSAAPSSPSVPPTLVSSPARSAPDPDDDD